MTPDELRDRSRQFAMRIVRLYQSLPKTAEAQVMGKQLLRAGTSVAANYRATCRSRSRAEFIAKMGVVVEEADESMFWLAAIAESGVFPAKKVQALQKEASELTKIFAASNRTARAGQKSLNHKSLNHK
jgi:four helix bundle protein